MRLTSRHALLIVFATATGLLMLVGALASIGLLQTSLDQVARQEAGRDARVVTDLGLAAALSRGRSRAAALQVASAEYAAARSDLLLAGAVIWLPSGQPIFARGTGRREAARHAEPRIATDALRARRTLVANGSEPGVGATVQAAVPLGRQAQRAVVEFHFSRRGIQQALGVAKQRLYTLTGLGALIMYLAILPLLARLARRVPLPTDPVRRAAAAELRSALSRDELILHYQPKAETVSGRIVGVEALVRWNHPRRGLLAPGEFLPIAEACPELWMPLTRRALDCAARDCARWLHDGRELPVAVNVAPSMLLEGSLMELVRETLDRHELPPRLLTLELTESALMESQEDVSEQFRELRALGVCIAIDDFGTGNSSLARLRSLPVDELKVDRSFVTGISTDDRAFGITRHIVNLGLELGVRVVAEGVEDERTQRLLGNLGCEVVQGCHLARPMAEAALRHWLAAREVPPLTVSAPAELLADGG